MSRLSKRSSYWLSLSLLFLAAAPSSAIPPPSLNVTASVGDLSPQWAPAPSANPGSPSATAALGATVSNPPTAPYPCTLYGPNWAWTVGTITQPVMYSPDGSTWSTANSSDYSAWIVQPYPNSATATLNVTYNVGGYWQFPCIVAVNYYDSGPCNDYWWGTASGTSNGTSFSVTILRKPDGGGDYQAIAGANANALVGQYIDLKAAVLPANAPVSAYSWTIPGITFLKYTANNNTATLTQVPAASYSNQTIQLIWADPAPNGRQVSCKVTSAGGSTTGTATMNILAPTVNYPTQLGKTRIADVVGKGKMMGLYESGAVTQGIVFNATVQVPAGFPDGQWQFVQLVTPSRTQTLVGGQKQHVNLNGATVLDTAYPYAGHWATGAAQQSTADSPGVGLNNAVIITITVNNEQYSMYVMFLPPGGNSQYVPLQYVQWSWTGTATWVPVLGNWALTGANQNAGAATPTSEHPLWTQNVSAGGWINN